ncbi:transposase [Halopolyspora algeriensis]|uniref:transposase n=1 Tax=Halopolyspora algeriensis TaxID=1500506 RepID=UPI000DF477E2|nr:transposase [Halopolyspora algeriensis]
MSHGAGVPEPGPEGRAVPFYCPYCGDEDLIPTSEPPGAWRCQACRRVFTVKLAGLALTEEDEEP